MGVTIASPSCQEQELHPVLDTVYPAEDFKSAFLRLENAEQTGKIALQIG